MKCNTINLWSGGHETRPLWSKFQATSVAPVLDVLSKLLSMFAAFEPTGKSVHVCNLLMISSNIQNVWPSQ